MKWRLWLKIGLSGIILAALTIGGWYGYAYYSAEDAPIMAAQATTTVTKGELSVKISGTGSISTTQQQTVTAGANGVIASVYAEEGAVIHKGDLLFTLEGADVANQIRSKELDLQKANLTLEELQLKYKEAEDDSRSSITVDLKKQQLAIQTAVEELEELRESQAETSIISSIDGKVGAINVEAGSSVTPATALTEIVNYDQLQLKVAIDELDISSVEIGQTAEIMVEAFSGDVFAGKVTAIADQGTASNGVASFDVTITLDEPGSIKAGMSAEASILVQQKSDVLLLPIDAVQSVNNRYFVLVPESADAAASESQQQGRPGSNGAAQSSGDNNQADSSGIPSAQGESPDTTGTSQSGERPAMGQAQTDGEAGQSGGRPAMGQAPTDSEAGQDSERPAMGQAPANGETGQNGSFPAMGEAPSDGSASQGGINGNPRAMGEGWTGSGAGAEAGSSGFRETRQGMQGTAGQARSGSATGSGSRMVFIETGINNEDYIEIVSGLAEGDVVIVPTVTTGTSNSSQNQFPGGMGEGGFSFPGANGGQGGATGGFGGGGGFSGGGFSGGGGGQAGGGQSGGGRP
ncbi:efflux RND transporter periplasmic adaptor subunit [Paenibacillus sp. CAU 1782]